MVFRSALLYLSSRFLLILNLFGWLTTAYTALNATAIGLVSEAFQPGPEKVSCTTGVQGELVDANVCTPVIQLVDRDADDNPGPQDWGGRDGFHEMLYQTNNCVCYILVRAQAEAPEVQFSFALVKRLALTVLNTCSIEAGEEGIGGTVAIAPFIYLSVGGIMTGYFH